MENLKAGDIDGGGDDVADADAAGGDDFDGGGNYVDDDGDGSFTVSIITGTWMVMVPHLRNRRLGDMT